MKYITSKNNTGFTLTDFIVTLILIVSLVVPIGLAIPTVIEYVTLKKTIERIQKTAHNEKEAREALNNQFMIDSIKSIRPDDIVITEVNNSVNLSFDYKQPIPLYGNVSLLIHYSAKTK